MNQNIRDFREKHIQLIRKSQRDDILNQKRSKVIFEMQVNDQLSNKNLMPVMNNTNYTQE
jgi:hypothetical protein